jgi:hypothetical protein
MSHLSPLLQDLSFDPEEVTAVKTWRTTWHVTRSRISASWKWIAKSLPGEFLQAAGSGERDASRLCERAIRGLTASDYRQRDS